jgi:hypothetical protein
MVKIFFSRKNHGNYLNLGNFHHVRKKLSESTELIHRKEILINWPNKPKNYFLTWNKIRIQYTPLNTFCLCSGVLLERTKKGNSFHKLKNKYHPEKK